MEICYIYCKEVPDSRGSFYALPVLRMAKMFEDSGHSIHVIGIGELETDSLERHGATCHVYNLRLKWLGLLGVYVQLFFIAVYHGWREEYDVFSNIWAHYNLGPVLIAGRLLGVNVFARVFGQGLPWNRDRGSEDARNATWRKRGKILLSRLLNAVESRLLNTCSYVYTNAESVRELLVNQGIARNQISVITQGVDTSYFTPPTEPTGNGNVLFVGRISSEEKRFEDALGAFESVQDALPDVDLHVVGAEEPPSELAERVNGDSSVHLHGYQNREELQESYQSASVLLLTSSKEGVPNVILEGHACSLPVVATDAGDVERILSESGGGIVAPVGDVDELSAGLERLVEQKQLREDMGENGREYVVEEHALPVAAEKYIELFSTRSAAT